MENLNGRSSCGDTADKAIATIGAICFVASFFGPIAWIITGPTAAGMAIAGLVCAYK